MAREMRKGSVGEEIRMREDEMGLDEGKRRRGDHMRKEREVRWG